MKTLKLSNRTKHLKGSNENYLLGQNTTCETQQDKTQRALAVIPVSYFC